MRAYFVGSHAVGKTTIARWVRDAYRLPLLTEVARVVLAQEEKRLEELAGDLPAATAYQEDVFRKQMAAEEAAGEDFVSDRAFDNLAYASWRAAPGTVRRIMDADAARAYLNDFRARAVAGTSRVFFVRPHPELLREDGVRANVTWDEVLRVDGAAQFALEVFGVPYVPISCREMADRVRVVSAVLGPPKEPAR